MSDELDDPDLYDPGPKPKRRRQKMATGTKEAEPKPVKVTGPINIKGQNYAAGDTVNLTDEELEAVKAAGAPVEGVEPPTDEEVQSKHEEGVEAQKEEAEKRAKAEEEGEEDEEKKEEDKKAKAKAKAIAEAPSLSPNVPPYPVQGR